MGFGIQEMWAMLNAMNIVLHLGVIKIGIPGNVYFIFETLAKFLIQELLPSDQLFEYLKLKFNQVPGINYGFERMGYDERNFIKALG
jgi:hypothetical protein